jgi:hypothetical protein
VFFLLTDCLPLPILFQHNVVTVDVWKGRIVISAKTIYRAPLIAVLALAGVVSTKADSITDPATNVSYNMTSTFVPDSNGLYEVTLTVDASHFSGTGGASTGFLSALAVQFSGTSGFAPISFPGGVDAWGNKPAAPNNSCESLTGPGGLPIGFGCSPNTSLNTVGAVPGTLTFVLGVGEPVGHSLSASAKIFAVYATTANGADPVFGGGTIIGETPITNISIQNSTSGGGTGGSDGGGGGTPVPEPSVFTLLGIGLVALVVFHRALMALPKVFTI